MKITRCGKETSVEGAAVRLRAYGLERGVCVDIEARRGRGWVLVAGSERTTAAVHRHTESWGPVLAAGNRVAAFSQELKTVEESDGAATLILSGKSGRNAATQELTVYEKERRVHVRTEITLGAPTRISSLFTPYVFVPDGMLYSQYSPLDFCWIPTLRRTPDHTIADQIFRSPAVIMQAGGILAALVPDLDVLAENRPAPAALELRLDNPDLDAPAFGYGFCPSGVEGHVFFKHSPSGFGPVKGKLVYAYDILAAADAPRGRGHRLAAEYLWSRYGKKHLTETAPQALPFEEYAKRAYRFAFESGKIWREFEIGGVRAAGTLAHTYAGKSGARVMKEKETRASLRMSRLIPKLHGAATDGLMGSPMVNDAVEQALHRFPVSVAPLVMFQAWFNNLRTAYGIYSYGELFGDGEMKEKALKMKELALAAPEEMGLTRGLCYCPEDGAPFWVQGTKGFEPVREYHLPDGAWTGWWLLRWHEEIGADARLLEKAERIGDAFVNFQLESGAVPGWVRVRKSGPVAATALRESGQTAAPGMFLARLARTAGGGKYLAAAERAAEFLIGNVFPENKWWDFETFFSCSKKKIGMVDAGTGIHCMNSLCVFWTAEMFRDLYGITGKAKYLEYGRRALDLLLLWQQVWNPPYISITAFGGFGVMNTDAEWNDARQSMFAESLMSWYEVTGEEEYFERGVAALRASFTTMLVPEHKEIAPGNMGMYEEVDEGAAYENYAHLGYDRRAPGYLMFDWGSGGACAAAAGIKKKYGDIHVDAAGGRAFGINFCTVESVKLSERSIGLRVESGAAEKRTLILKAAGLEAGKYSVAINGKARGRYTAAALEKGIQVEV